MTLFISSYGENMTVVKDDVFKILEEEENHYITPGFIAEKLGYGVDAEEEIRAFIDPLCHSDPKSGKTPSYGSGQYRINSINVLDKGRKITAYRYEDTALEFLG